MYVSTTPSLRDFPLNSQARSAVREIDSAISKWISTNPIKAEIFIRDPLKALYDIKQNISADSLGMLQIFQDHLEKQQQLLQPVAVGSLRVTFAPERKDKPEPQKEKQLPVKKPAVRRSKIKKEKSSTRRSKIKNQRLGK